MRITVVVSTYNRADSLQQTLAGLRRQTHDDFEVVVVNGPSTDATADLLAATPDVRALNCSVANLSRSRNLGVAAAAGDVVAFIDDDAIPESTWLDGLDAAYGDATVVGAGGMVFDHTGVDLQYRHCVCDRVGVPRFDVHPPLERFNAPGADPFLYLLGTNMSFRRSSLVDVGGFDDDIEYMYEEVEVCLRLVDAGGRLVAVDGAAVHHKYLPSHIRNERRITTQPFLPVRNRAYFALQYGRSTRTTGEVIRGVIEHCEEIKRYTRGAYELGHLTEAEVASIEEQVDAGFDAGIRRGLGGTRVVTAIPPADRAAFRPFATMRPPEGRLSVCLLSQEYPPRDFGGVGRYTADLACGLAARGHEVHVFTRSPDTARVDFDDGVWMHRLVHRDGSLPDLAGHPMAHNLSLVAGRHREVSNLHNRVPVDLVLSPLWLCEGAVCELDERFATVVTLVTSHKTISGILSAWQNDDHIRGMVALERATLARGRHIHGISRAIVKTVRAEHGVDLDGALVVPLGLRDRRAEHPPPPNDPERVELLFVGRLERRKGADTLLLCVPALLEEFPGLHVTLAGRDTANTGIGTTYRERFLEEHAVSPEVVDRVTFTGEVDEEHLYSLYAGCDLFCAPSRYESFGLVLLEAMMFGKPVVAGAAGGMPEIVEDGASGLLCVPGDSASLADCLRKLIADAGLRRRLGARSRELFEERYTRERMVEGILGAFGPAGLAAREARAGADPAGLRGRLARLVGEVTGLDEGAAARTATLLLDAPDEAGHLILSLRRLWGRPARDFVAGVHLLLTGLPPTADAHAGVVRRLEEGTSRAAIVRDMATSDEARRHLGDLQWLDRLDPMLDEVKVARIQALWPAPAGTFLAGLFDLVAGRPARRSEWVRAMAGMAAGRSRLDTLRAVAAAHGVGAGAGWLGAVAAAAAAAATAPSSGGLRSALGAPDEEFVDAVYQVILRRDPDRDGRTGMLTRLRARTPRGLVIHDVALSDEVVERRLDTGFLLGVEGPRSEPLRRWRRHSGPVMRALHRGHALVRRRSRSRGPAGPRF